MIRFWLASLLIRTASRIEKSVRAKTNLNQSLSRVEEDIVAPGSRPPNHGPCKCQPQPEEPDTVGAPPYLSFVGDDGAISFHYPMAVSWIKAFPKSDVGGLSLRQYAEMRIMDCPALGDSIYDKLKPAIMVEEREEDILISLEFSIYTERSRIGPEV